MKKRIFSFALALLIAALSLPLSASALSEKQSGLYGAQKLSKEEIIQLLQDNPNDTPQDIYDIEPSSSAPYAAGKLKDSVLQRLVNRLNALRAMAGLPSVPLDMEWCEIAQYGPIVLSALGVLSHGPEKPSDMDDDFYQKAYEACSTSNLYAGERLGRTPDGWMYDPGQNNAADLGHRRWQLNPNMGRVGFGYADGFTAEKCVDNSARHSDYDFISWPASGNFPTGDFFDENALWSVTLNPELYQAPSVYDVRVVVTRHEDGRVWDLHIEQDETGYYSTNFTVSNRNYGVNNCIIFYPRMDDDFRYGGYTVEITGIYAKDGTPADLCYTVDLFDPETYGKPTPTPSPTPVPDSEFEIENGVLLGYDGPGGEVVIPDGVTSIGNSAFEDNGDITRVTIPNGVTRVGHYAFTGCSNLTGVTFPDSLESIGSYAFYRDTALTSAVLPDSVKTIETRAFAFSGLVSVNVPASVTELDSLAFEGCESLRRITVDPYNSVYASVDGVLFTKDLRTLLTYPRDHGSTYAIPYSVTKLEDLSMSLANLTQVVIPPSVTTIGKRVFEGNYDLTELALPASITTLDEASFALTGITSITIPEGVTALPRQLFSACRSLTTVSIPSSVTSIGWNIFEYCESLSDVYFGGTQAQWEQLGYSDEYLAKAVIHFKDTGSEEPGPAEDFVIDGDGVLIEYNGPYNAASVTVPDGVTAIGPSAFVNTSIGSITIPEGVTSIGWAAFAGCVDLTTVFLPSTLTRLENCFANNDSLSDIYFNGTMEQWGQIDFVDDSGQNIWLKQSAVHCTDGDILPEAPEEFIIDENGTLTGYNGPGGDVVVPDGVKRIESTAFQYNDSITSITFPSCVTSIGSLAFQYCRGLVSIQIPAGVTELDRVFYGCTSLENVSIPSTVTDMSGLFYNCVSLRSITIPDSVTCLDDTFAYCTGLVSVTVPNGVTSLDGTFAYCGNLSRVSLPASVARMGDSYSVDTGAGLETKNSPFVGCSSLKDIYYGGSKAQWKAIGTIEPVGSVVVGSRESVWDHIKDAVVHCRDGVITPAPDFTDVAEDAWYKNAVDWAIESRITSGTGDGTTFSPNKSCTRAEIVQFLWKRAGSPIVQASGNFRDVPSNAWYRNAVNWAIANNITKGTDSSHFSPDKTCSRAEAVAFMWNAAGKPFAFSLGSFADVPRNAWYRNAVNWAVSKGITSGTGRGMFSPDKTCTRAEIVQLLYKDQ